MEILDFTNKGATKILKNGSSLCEVIHDKVNSEVFKIVNNVQYINIQSLKHIIHIVNDEVNYHYLKYNDNIYCMSYYGDQYGTVNNNIEIFNKTINNTIYNTIKIKRGFILYNICKSVGHELCFVLSGIYLLCRLNMINDYDIIIADSYVQFGTFMKSILLLFFSEDKIHFIDDKTIVDISESIIYTPNHCKVPAHNNILLDKLVLYKNINTYFKNVCLIKLSTDNHMNTPTLAFNKSYLDLFVENNFNVFNPGQYNVTELYNIINNCDNLVLSWGANSWLNSIFVNIKTNVLVLCHTGYSHQYSSRNYTKYEASICTPVCNKLIMVYDLLSDLSHENAIMLKTKIDTLIN